MDKLKKGVRNLSDSFLASLAPAAVAVRSFGARSVWVDPPEDPDRRSWRISVCDRSGEKGEDRIS